MKALMIVTSHARLGNTGNATGLFLSELSHPYDVFQEQGYQVDVASPAGGDAPVDPNSLGDEAIKARVSLAANTLRLADVNVAEYDAVYLVGGHGTMFDLPGNSHLQQLLSDADANGKVIAAVCHGQSGLVNVRRADGSYLLDGRRVTSFSNEEEGIVGLTGVVPFLLQDKLVERGADYRSGPAWGEHVVSDGRLVTGQNPASAAGVAQAVCQLLRQHADSALEATA